MNAHRIRLRGPWQYQWLSDRQQHLGGGRVSLPQEWKDLFGMEAGRVRFQRTFHCPTNLEPTSRVDLALEGIGGDARIALNDRDLGRFGCDADSEFPLRLEITDLLLPTNDLQVEIHFQPSQTTQPGGLWGMVVLEILE